MEAKAALWTLVGIFVVFKLATTAMIVAADPDAAELALGFFLAFHLQVIIVGLIAGLGGGGAWLLFRARLVRVRARRRQLQAAEWRAD